MPGGVRGGGCSGWEIQLCQYARDVPVDGVFAEGESVGNVVVGHPVRHQAEDLCLAATKAGRFVGLLANLAFYLAQQCRGGASITFRAKILEGDERGSHLRFGYLAVMFTQGLREQQARAGPASKGISRLTNVLTAASR